MMLSGPLKALFFPGPQQVTRKAKREHYPAPYAILSCGRSTTATRSGPPASRASVEALFAHPTTET